MALPRRLRDTPGAAAALRRRHTICELITNY
jgi:hypothetical protein